MFNAIRKFFASLGPMATGLSGKPLGGFSNASLWQHPRMTDTEMTDFIGWLDTKPRDGEYDAGQSESCLIAQYLRDYRKIDASVGINFWSKGRRQHDIPTMLQEIAYTEPHTFGAARERANSYVAAENDLLATATWIGNVR